MPLYKSNSKLNVEFNLNGKNVSTETNNRTLLSDFIRHTV